MKKFFKNIFGKKQQRAEPAKEPSKDEKSIDDAFVTNFIEKGGKLLYCSEKNECLGFLKKIMRENGWETLFCTNPGLQDHLKSLGIDTDKHASAFYTPCENLIASDGSIMFSSNQLGETRLNMYPANFIVFARTSQFVRNKDEGLTAIKFRFQDRIPTNISAITDYRPDKKDPGFMDYGNLNSKNLYLILWEDL